MTERSAILALRHARVRVGRDSKRILAVLRLATKNPWAVDVTYKGDPLAYYEPLVFP